MRWSIPIVVILAYLLAHSLFSPPGGRPPDEAMDHVRAIARAPRPMGSAEHARVRGYLLEQAARMGLTTETQEAIVHRGTRRSTRVAKVRNVLATLPGTAGSHTVLVVAHYDSEPRTPGAADNASAVAAALHAARILSAEPRGRNDIAFLFTDGEEIGFMGARAFEGQADLVLNLDAGGSSGPALILDTSGGSGWILREIRRAHPHLFGTSALRELHRLGSGRTDFTVFRKAGIPGLDAAFLEGACHYHGMTDTPGYLDPGSLRHQAEMILAVARTFRDRPLEGRDGEDVTYFNPAGSWMLVYPGWGDTLLVAMVAVMFTTYLILGIRKGRISPGGILGGIGVLLGTIIVGSALIFGLGLLNRTLHPHHAGFYNDTYFNAPIFFIAYGALGVAFFTGIYQHLFSRLRWENLAGGMLAYGLLWSIALYFLAPSASHIHAYPLLFILAAWILCLGMGWFEERRPVPFALTLLLGVLPVIFLFAPMIRLSFAIAGPRYACIAAAGLLEVCGYCIPQIRSSHRALPPAALMVGVVLYAAGHFTSGRTQDHFPIPELRGPEIRSTEEAGTLEVVPSHPGSILTVSIPDGVTGLAVDGVPIPSVEKPVVIHGVGEEGIRIAVTWEGPDPPQISVTERIPGFPAQVTLPMHFR